MSIKHDWTSANLLAWAFRAVAALMALVTIHYIGFFSTLSNDYFFAMSSTLIRRVAWELVSTLAFTSLMVAIYLLVAGLFRGTLIGVLHSSKVVDIDKLPWYPIDLYKIAGLYLVVLMVKYFPANDLTVYQTILRVTAGLFLASILYFLFAKDFGSDSKWARFVAPLRQKELAVRAVISLSMAVAFFSGKGLAWTMLSQSPSKVTTHTGVHLAVVLDISDTTLLMKSGNKLILLPMHEVVEVELPFKFGSERPFNEN